MNRLYFSEKNAAFLLSELLILTFYNLGFTAWGNSQATKHFFKLCSSHCLVSFFISRQDAELHMHDVHLCMYNRKQLRSQQCEMVSTLPYSTEMQRLKISAHFSFEISYDLTSLLRNLCEWVCNLTV